MENSNMKNLHQTCTRTRGGAFDELNQGQQKKILCKEITGENTLMINKF